MKVAIITDQHFGARKNSKLFHDYFLKFYDDIFFPYLEEHGISVVVDMGDTFDSRKGIDFSALSWAKDNYYDRLERMGISVHTIVGNHTAYYKNTNNVNAVDLLLREYDKVAVYSEPTEVKLDNLKVLFIPWINQENEAKTLKLIEKTNCKCAMGHLELQGFRVNRQIVMEHGMECSIFDKFSNVFSGHYHTRSTNGKVHYLGNPYEIYWTDVGDKRGFTIFDTETQEFFSVDNPHRIFYNIYYEDTDYQTFDAREYANKIVKVVVRKKSDTKKFEKFIDKLYAIGVAELKVTENFEFGGWYQQEDFDPLESEDTLSILNRYIEEAEISLDKSMVQKIMQEIYQEACELI
jgi:DNA repair exonuclease SbcCD nuclease subunit|tara:strand:+ start:142 stop:1191 length:1050 start_codon:yes stop_codon:yes gene_type:complete